MVICKEEITSESNKEAMEENGAMVSMAATQWPKQSGTVLFQRNRSLCVSFFRDFQGVVLKLYQSPEIRRDNFMTFLPTGTQVKLFLEIPQAPNSLPRNNNSVKMLDWNSNTELLSKRPQIIRTLREMVKTAVMAFRLSSSPLTNLHESGNFDDVVEAVPVSFRPAAPTNLDMVVSPKKRVTTLLVGETLVSFELPHNCSFNLEDLEKLVEVERKEGMAPKSNGDQNNYNVPQYTFLQRFEGWKMERRQRVNGRFDMYYHHLRSTKVFRSIAEVVNFFLYEICPDKPQKSSTKLSKLGEDGISGKKTERKEKRVTPLKRKIDEINKKPREKWEPIYDLNVDIQKAYYEHHHQNPKLYQEKNVDDQKANDHQHHHIPFFDLNDGDQTRDDDDDDRDRDQKLDLDDDDDENPICEKEKVEKFLAESYENLMNLPHAQKCTSNFSFDINEKISEEKVEDGNFNDPNNLTADELLAEAYDNLMSYHKNEPKLQKGKEKRSTSRSTEKPRRKKVKTFTPKPFPSFPININSIPSEKKNNYDKEKGKEKEKIIIADTVMEEESCKDVEEVQKVASNVKHKRFNIKEVNGKVVFIDVDCEPATGTSSSIGAGDGGGVSSCSAKEVAKSVAFLHMDECDLINHIPESSDMFDLAMFLTNNRGNNSGGF